MMVEMMMVMVMMKQSGKDEKAGSGYLCSVRDWFAFFLHASFLPTPFAVRLHSRMHLARSRSGCVCVYGYSVGMMFGFLKGVTTTAAAVCFELLLLLLTASASYSAPIRFR